MMEFYANFVKEFSRLAEPLHALKRKGAAFLWDEPQLKISITTPPVLQVADFSKEFVLVCNSSDIVVSPVLNQRQGEALVPIAFANRLLNTAERKYSIYEKEFLDVVWGCERFRVYLELKEFTLHTDNQAFSWLLKHVKEDGRMGRWILRLPPYKSKVVHISGKNKVVADCLTRQYEDSPEQSFSGLVLQHLPAAFQSIREHLIKDAYCRGCMRGLSELILVFVTSNWRMALLSIPLPGIRLKKYLVLMAFKVMIFKYFLGQHTTGFQAEVYAIKACIMANLDRNYRNRNIYILSDSQAALEALDKHQINSKLIWNCHQILMELAKHNRVQLI
jgi:hypothetical protein